MSEGGFGQRNEGTMPARADQSNRGQRPGEAAFLRPALRES